MRERGHIDFHVAESLHWLAGGRTGSSGVGHRTVKDDIAPADPVDPVVVVVAIWYEVKRNSLKSSFLSDRTPVVLGTLPSFWKSFRCRNWIPMRRSDLCPFAIVFTFPGPASLPPAYLGPR